MGITVTLTTGLNPEAHGVVKILYWTEAYVTLIFDISAERFKSTIESELTNTLNKYLPMLIEMDNKMNHYNKTLIKL